MGKKEILFGLMLAIFLAAILSPFASPWPDGLEKVAYIKGFLNKGEVDPVFSSPIPDYTWPQVRSEKVATSVAGIAGTLLVFGIGYGLAALIRRYSAQ
jgi:cobalt/nickel transport protein